MQSGLRYKTHFEGVLISADDTASVVYIDMTLKIKMMNKYLIHEYTSVHSRIHKYIFKLVKSL